MAYGSILKNIGTSSYVSISGEDFNPLHPQIFTDFDDDEIVSPPITGVGGATSKAMEYIQPWPSWNFSKLTEPKFDGIAQYLGQISNRPDFISDYHFIGLMRNIDHLLVPMFSAYIGSYSNMPRASRAPGPRSTS